MAVFGVRRSGRVYSLRYCSAEPPTKWLWIVNMQESWQSAGVPIPAAIWRNS